MKVGMMRRKDTTILRSLKIQTLVRVVSHRCISTVSSLGHFTQMVWAQSHYLGVGVARSSTTGKYITVMKYDPAGNYMGKYRENVFRPANCGGKKIIDL